jgi:hypothetical protein
MLIAKMKNAVVLLGTSLKLTANEIVIVESATNIPDKGKYYVRNPTWQHDGSILVDAEDINWESCYSEIP